MLLSRRRFRVLPACAIAVGLLACKGGSIADDTTTTIPDVSSGGIYAGTLSSTIQGATYNLIGAVNEGGALELINTSNQNQYSGQLTVGGTTASSPVTGTLRVYDNTGALFTTGTLSGTVVTRSQIAVTYTLASGDTGQIMLNENNTLYSTPETLATAAGNYQYVSTRNGGASTLTVNLDGSLTGTTEYGCAFTGTASVANTSYDLFNLVLYASSSSACGTAAGATFGGLAYYTPATGTTPAMLTSAATTGSYGIYANYTHE